MFEEFYKNWKKDLDQFARSTFDKFNEHYDKLWEEVTKEVQQRKVKLEKENNDLEEEMLRKTNDINTLTEDLIKLEEGVQKGNEELPIVKGKLEEIKVEYLEYEKKIDGITKREKDVNTKVELNKDMDMQLKAREINLEEKNRSMKRVLDKLT